MIGKTISHYKIIEKLGEGGMGVVYKAEDTKLEREVAVKFLPTHISGNDDERERFKIEAKAAAALNHPNVCTIYEIQDQHDPPFIVMEFVDGEDLRNLVAQANESTQLLPFDAVVAYATQIGDALQEAHGKGIIHRDIKSDNIMVNGKNQIKVMDFGLAKLKGIARLTKAGSTVGTLAYMAPEHLQGAEADARSDIFSYGVVLYEMLTGRLPFEDDYEAAIMYSILNEEPPPVEKHRVDVPATMQHILERALEKDPEDRYQSIAEIVRELRRLKKHTSKVSRRSIPVPTPVADTKASPEQPAAEFSSAVSPEKKGVSGAHPATKFSLKRGLALVAAILAVVIIGFFAYRFLKTRHAAAPVYATFTQLTAAAEVETFPDISPDGKYVIYTREAEEQTDIFFQRVGGGNALNLTKGSAAADYEPVFSPDGEQIAFRSERDGGGIFVMGATGESVRRLTAAGYNPVWSPDGTHLLYATENVSNPYDRATISSLWTVQLGSGERRNIFSGDAVQPCYSPHGFRIAFWKLRGQGGQRDLYTIPAEGGEPVGVTNDAAVDWNPIWSSDGAYLYFASDRGGSMNMWRIPIDEESGKVLGKPQPITTPSRNMVHLRLSRDGTKAVYASLNRRSNIFKLALDPDKEEVEGTPVPVTRGNQVYLEQHVAPDGKQLVFRSGGQEDLFISDTDGRNLRKLTNDVFKDRRPRWSPDGQQILFYSDRSGKYELWTIKPDGSDLTQLTHAPDDVSLLFWPAFFPDGKHIFAIGTHGTYIFDFPLTSTEWSPHILPTLENDQKLFLATSVSPDGRWLAGRTEVRNARRESRFVLYSMQTQEYQFLADGGGGFCSWLNDSRRLLFSDRNGLSLIDRVTKQSHPILLNSGTVGYFDVTPSADNKTLYFRGDETESDIWMANLDSP